MGVVCMEEYPPLLGNSPPLSKHSRPLFSPSAYHHFKTIEQHQPAKLLIKQTVNPDLVGLNLSNKRWFDKFDMDWLVK